MYYNEGTPPTTIHHDLHVPKASAPEPVCTKDKDNLEVEVALSTMRERIKLHGIALNELHKRLECVLLCDKPSVEEIAPTPFECELAQKLFNLRMKIDAYTTEINDILRALQL